jgi:hypothetical protein
VEEDEQRSTTSAAARHDERLSEISAQEPAVQSEAHYTCALRTRAAALVVPEDDKRCRHGKDEKSER